jgi:hypothetical protein
MDGPFKDHGNNMWAPIARGAYVQVSEKPRASSRWHVWPKEWRAAAWDERTTWTWKKMRIELLYVADV